MGAKDPEAAGGAAMGGDEAGTTAAAATAAAATTAAPATTAAAGVAAATAPAGLLRTGELIERSGVSRQVIYTYLTMGLLAEAATTPSGQKLFDPRAVGCIRIVQRLKDEQFTLRDIQQIFGAQLAAACRGEGPDEGPPAPTP